MTITENIFSRSSTAAAYVSPIIWDDKLEKYVYDAAVFPRFAVNDTRHLNKPGRQVNYQFNAGYSMGLLTEGIATPVSELSFTQVTLTFNAYGDAKQITEEELAQGFDYLLSDIKQNAVGSAIENRDAVIVTELLTSSGTGIYSNGKASGTISSTDTFNTDMVADLKVAMAQSQAKECQGIVVHPEQYGDMLKLPNFVNASQYGDGRVIRSGEIGSYIGIPIMMSNQITTASENSITVYKAIALGRRPFVYATKKMMTFGFEQETLRDRTITASWWEMFGVSILRNDSVIIMTSA